MKKTSRILASILVTTTLFSFTSTNAFASPVNNDSEAVLETHAQMDIDTLYSRAKNHISDIDVPEPSQDDAVVEGPGKVKLYRTAQLLKKTKKSNGEIEDTIAITTFTDVYLDVTPLDVSTGQYPGQ